MCGEKVPKMHLSFLSSRTNPVSGYSHPIQPRRPSSILTNVIEFIVISAALDANANGAVWKSEICWMRKFLGDKKLQRSIASK